jgi:gamma-glutamyltranspeptidase/glutathione hydrolase
VRGTIAAGHPLTAEAGARALAAGGNAVDACVAAAFVACVTESPLTGPGAGGFLLVHSAATGRATVLDAFVATPGRGLAPAAGGVMDEVRVPFDERSSELQTFRIGGAACAAPGLVAGLAEGHRLFGRLPWEGLVRPAAALARDGLELNAMQASLHWILDGVLRRSDEGRKAYGAARLEAGERLTLPDLADTLDAVAEHGAQTLYRGELARRIAQAVQAEGGRLTEADLAEYRVIRRRPVRARFRGHELVANAPPSSGGVLVAYALRLLDRLGPQPPFGSVEALARLAEVMRAASRARARGFTRALYRGGLAQRLLAEANVEAEAERIRRREREIVREPAGLPSTTHVSVLDAEGNAASLSSSTGCGSGVIVPGTGIHLNNMLGELDLNPAGVAGRPGRRLTSMMAPSILLHRGRPRLVVGSAGSERLRAAILQIVVNVVDHGMDVRAGIDAPRVYLDGDRLHVEDGFADDAVAALEAVGYELVRWPGRNLFFGGAAAVAVGDAGLEAAGDPRRGGAGVVVP